MNHEAKSIDEEVQGDFSSNFDEQRMVDLVVNLVDDGEGGANSNDCHENAQPQFKPRKDENFFFLNVSLLLNICSR